MPASDLTAQVLGAMITPAVLISAGGTLVLSTSNRLSRVVDRVRVLALDTERLIQTAPEVVHARKQALILEQLTDLSARAVLLRSALAALYAAIGLLVATSISVGAFTIFEWRYEGASVALAMLGACALLWGSVLLVREGRLALRSTFEEMRYVRSIVREAGGSEREI